jgi:hypothetical protein
MADWRTKGMSSEYAIALVLGLIALQVLTYNVMDRRTHAIALVVSTGIYRGTPIAAWHRFGLLRLAWFGAVALQLAYMFLAGVGWLFFGRNASTEELQLLAHLMAFISFMGVVGWLVAMPFFWYGRLSSVVRQAEAD